MKVIRSLQCFVVDTFSYALENHSPMARIKPEGVATVVKIPSSYLILIFLLQLDVSSSLTVSFPCLKPVPLASADHRCWIWCRPWNYQLYHHYIRSKESFVVTKLSWSHAKSQERAEKRNWRLRF